MSSTAVHTTVALCLLAALSACATHPTPPVAAPAPAETPVAPAPAPVPPAPVPPPSSVDQLQSLLQQLPDADVQIKRLDNGDLLLRATGDAAFSSGSAVLSQHFKQFLTQVVNGLQDHTDLQVQVTGHTDALGAARQNQRLSEARAQATADFLYKNGVAAERLFSDGKGPTQPIGPNNTAEGRAANRRVELVITPAH